MPWTGSTIPPAQSTTPAAPGTSTTPPSASTPDLNANPNAAPENAAANPSGQDFAFGGSQGLASGAGTFASPGGYLDDAIPQTMFRLRFEARDGINEFDRAQYMYASWKEMSFHVHALVNNGAVQGGIIDTKARGSQIFSTDLSDQTISAYMEVAVNNRFSAFLNVPQRYVQFLNNPEETQENSTRIRSKNEDALFVETAEVRNAKTGDNGISDIDAGFKYALIACPNQRFLTFQFRTYTPTGDPGLGLGTGHWSLEPSFLLFQRLSDRLVLQGQLTDWVPISAGPGAGNVITYGGGLGYDVYRNCKIRVTPVAEFVGWTVLDGTEAFEGTVPGATTATTGPTAQVPLVNVNGQMLPGDHGFSNASGDTIVNAKIGVRTYFGQNSDVYVGYGRSLTGDRWYKDIYRVEYRLHF
jgi:hypothetical protein